jgi:hypothetical protein
VSWSVNSRRWSKKVCFCGGGVVYLGISLKQQKQKIMLSDLAIDHPYYASGSNYYSNDAAGHYNTWADFYEEFHDADVDMNLVFRWDIRKSEEKSKPYYMQVIIIAQRKGIYMPIHIDSVGEQDVPQIEQFMKPHFEKLLSIWQPLSDKFLNQPTSPPMK